MWFPLILAIGIGTAVALAGRARRRPPETGSVSLCATPAARVNLDSDADLSAWAECPGRTLPQLRALAARLDAAATAEADTDRRARLIDAHVGLMDWIDRRETA